MSDRDYQKGKNTAARIMLSSCLGILTEADLGSDIDIARFLRLVSERSETIEALRELCDLIGDNDWPDDLYLPDIIRKHIIPIIDEVST